MAATDAPPNTSTAADGNAATDASPSRGAGRRESASSPPAEKQTTDYAVYEATEVKDGVPVTLTLIGKVTAESPKEARWLAADANKAVAERTKATAKGDPPLLLPVAVRLAQPTATREEQEIKVKRG